MAGFASSIGRHSRSAGRRSRRSIQSRQAAAKKVVKEHQQHHGHATNEGAGNISASCGRSTSSSKDTYHTQSTDGSVKKKKVFGGFFQ